MFSFLLFKIFFARIIDVSLGTYKTLLTVKGKITLPTFIAFLEIIIWFYVAREALLVDKNSILIPVAYASGYAVGNLVGTIISHKLINSVIELKVYKYNKKILSYLNKNKINYYYLNSELIILYLSKNKDDKVVENIHKLSKKSIIYIKEVKLDKLKKKKIIFI